MAVRTDIAPVKKALSRRKLLGGLLMGLGGTALSAGIVEREEIAHLFQFLENLLIKVNFANSSLVQGFLHPPDIECAAKNTSIQFAPEAFLYEVAEAGDSVGKGFFWKKNGQEGSAPVSLFYGGAINTFLHQDAYLQQGYYGCATENVAVKSTVLSDLPHQFSQLKFAGPTTLIISDGGNLLLQWCIENEAFLESLLAQFQGSANASDTEIQNLQRALERLRVAVESVCLVIQGHYEIALGDLLGFKLNNAQLDTVVILGIPPVWKASAIPLTVEAHPKKTFPMRGNPAAEVFGRYLVVSGNNAIKAAMNNAYEFLKMYGIALRYQDITSVVEVMDGIHPVPSEQRKIAQELLQHTYLGRTSLGNIAVPPFYDG